jgi:hypothetical protein
LFGLSRVSPRQPQPIVNSVFNSPARKREAAQVYKISTFVSTKNRLPPRRRSLMRHAWFSHQLQIREARELSFRVCSGFTRKFRRARLPAQNSICKTQASRREARGHQNRAASRKPKMFFKEILFAVAKTKNRTIEMTWGETNYTQAKV